jgi:hypoxanthine-guanine phosphoribosyltransferase
MAISSYGAGCDSGEVRILKDTRRGHRRLAHPVVEDIVDMAGSTCYLLAI